MRIVDLREARGIKFEVIFRGSVFAFGLIVMAVCTANAQTPSAGDSGIEGTISVKPARPGPTRIDEALSVPLAKATFVAEGNNRTATSFTTDDQGHFRVSLPPGHYKVSLQERKSSIGSFGPFEIDVVPGRMTNAQWVCDSGIR